MDQMIAMNQDTHPITLAAGHLDLGLRQFEKVTDLCPDFENPFDNGEAFAERWDLTVQANQPRIYLDKIDLATGVWAVAVDADFIDKDVTEVGKGE